MHQTLSVMLTRVCTELVVQFETQSKRAHRSRIHILSVIREGPPQVQIRELTSTSSCKKAMPYRIVRVINCDLRWLPGHRYSSLLAVVLL